MGWSTHAAGTNDPPEVRNWTIHLIALVASMSALASESKSYVIDCRAETPAPPFDKFISLYSIKLIHAQVGYDTSVIGGTMALDSFRLHFDLLDKPESQLDTIQGNIVSTFQ